MRRGEPDERSISGSSAWICATIAADRLVDERKPDLVVLGHRGARLLERTATASATRAARRRRESSTAKSAQGVLGQRRRDWTPSSAAAIDETPSTSAAPRRSCRSGAAATRRRRPSAGSRAATSPRARAAEAERDERRHEQDPAADPKNREARPGRDRARAAMRQRGVARCRPLRGRQEQPSATPARTRRTRARSAARDALLHGSCRDRPGAAGSRRARVARRRDPRTAYRIVPVERVIPIAAERGRRGRMRPERPRQDAGAATATMPPPTPKRALKKPATEADADEFSGTAVS
jgi:hypothetical protein